MAANMFICPECNAKHPQKKIVSNNYACLNPKCSLNYRLMVHGEITTSGKLSQLHGWVLEPGTILKKKYKIIKMLGKGGFGATYLTEDQSMFDQLRAIKETPLAYWDDEEDEFLTLLNHPGIPKLYERFKSENFHYSVMEFVDGQSLEDMGKKKPGGMPEQKVLPIAEQLCDVLKYIHSKRIVHRDLKPENVLVRKDGTIALIDFGIAKKYVVGQGTRHLARAASHFYSSPEQYSVGKGATNYKSDIYSFGAILYFLTTGLEPVDALSRDPNKDVDPLPRSVNPGVSVKLQYVITKAMKMQKHDRFRSMGEIQTYLFGPTRQISKKICKKCKSFLDIGNNFCPNCGTSTQPVKSASPPVTVHFTFRSKKQVSTVKQLVEYCYNNWKDGIYHLYQGDFERWLARTKTGDGLAQKAAAIRKTQHDKDIGLNEFLMSSGYGQPAVMDVKPGRIDFGKIQKQGQKSHTITILNNGKGLLTGAIENPVKWLTLKPAKFHCPANERASILAVINTAMLNGKKKYKTGITIQSNVEHKTIPVSLEVDSYTTKTILPHKKKQKKRNNTILESMVLFTAIMLMVRYLGPGASFAVSDTYMIVLTGLLFGGILSFQGLIEGGIGLLIGACMGALLNIIAFFIYADINNYINAFLHYISVSSTNYMNLAGWGAGGICIGSLLGIIIKKDRKPQRNILNMYRN